MSFYDNYSLTSHCKFTIILITIGECKSDNVIPRIGNVNLQAIRCEYRKAIYLST